MIPQRFIRLFVDRPYAALILPLLIAVASLTGCHHSPAFSDEGISAAQSLPLNSFQLQWTAQLETSHGAITKLFSRESLIFGYTDDGTSYVMDRQTGRILHAETIRNGGRFLHPPVVLKDFIIYPTATALEIYDKAGLPVRSKNLSFSLRSDAVGSKNYVYFGADHINGGRLVSVDITNEYLDARWSLMFPRSGVRSAPAVLGDIVYAAADNGDVAAVSYDTREPIWGTPQGVFHTFGAVTADLVADDTGVYVASTDGTLSVLNKNNGKVKWQYLAAASLQDAPVVTKDMVFLKVDGVGVVALDKILGDYSRKPRWIAADIAKILSADDRNVYVLRQDGIVLALDKQTGKALFTTKRHDLVTFTTNVRDVTIYAVTSANRVLAITPVLKPGTVGEIAQQMLKSENDAIALAK